MELASLGVQIDGKVEYLDGFADYRLDTEHPMLGFGGWFDFPPELIAIRNESIKRSWTPERRKQQSEKLKAYHASMTETEKASALAIRRAGAAAMTDEAKAIRLARIRAAVGTPEARARNSERVKAQWAKRRAS